MIEIRVPDEQEGTKAVVRSWLKKVGDPVAENDPLVELETDKVTQEVPAPAAGVLAEILLDTDAEAVPGAILGGSTPVPRRRPGTRGRSLLLQASQTKRLPALLGPDLRRGTVKVDSPPPSAGHSSRTGSTPPG